DQGNKINKFNNTLNHHTYIKSQMVNYKHPFCKRTFSSRSGYSQHVNICDQSISDKSDNSIMDINNILLESEEIFNSIEMNDKSLYKDLPPLVKELLLSDDHNSNFENIIFEDSIINQDILEP
ncbi:13687_t:CDS:2, partial [Funneliformis geosporum]